MARRVNGSNGTVSEVAKRSYWGKADARIVVEAWRRSGEALAAFARRHGLQPSRISRWSARLPKPSSNGDGLEFHPVRVVQSAEPPPGLDGIEVVLVDGRRVRIPAGFAAEELRRVLMVLDGDA